MPRPSPICGIRPTLFCGGNAEEMVKYYTTIFPDSTIEKTVTYPSWGKEHHGYEAGETLAIEFSLLNDAIKMAAVTGPPNKFKFNEAISFTLEPDGQEETDYYWNKLTNGADQSKQFCCWCQDRFGLWWQVIPKQFKAMYAGSDDEEKRSKAMEISMRWKKADLAELDREMRKVDETREARES